MNANIPKKTAAGRARLRAKKQARRYGDQTRPPKQKRERSRS